MQNQDITLTPEEIKAVKGRGFLHNRGTRNFSGRIITENGVLTGKQLEVVGQAAEKFGNGKVTFTVRMTAEIQGIPYENIDAFQEFVGKAGMVTGGTGARVRPIVACKGTTCVFGLCDTQGIAKEVHKRFYEGYYHVVLPHKFKITIGGCPNNCAKPDLNDIGIIGQLPPKHNLDLCKGCKKCGVETNCPMGAASVVDGKLSIDKTICNSCGRCFGRCHFKIEHPAEHCFKIYIGGRWGKKVRMGTLLNAYFTKEEALDIIEKSLLLFKSQGISRERFSETIDRIGVEKVEELLLSDVLLKDKEKILEMEVQAR